MIKRNKGTLLLTTVILLLPLVIGLALWNKLPEQVPMHWNIEGEVDGWGSKAMLVFVLPMFLVGLQWIGALVTSLDPRNKDIHGKPLQLALWICPFISLLVHTLVYAKVLGYDISVEIIMQLVMGLMFMVIGNFLPKCKRNNTLGIKLPWTLNDDEIWNKTHRLTGRVWVFGGAIIAATAVFGNFIVSFAITMLMVLIPTVYSYLLYRRKKKSVT